MTINDPTPPFSSAHRANLITRVKNIILTPKTEWAVIDAEPATIQNLYLGYVCILAAIPAVASLIGGLAFGAAGMGIAWRPSPMSLITAAVVTYVLALASVAVIALIMEFLAPNFGGTKDRVQAFKVAAYFPTAAWLAGIFGLVPMLAILALVGLYSLYLLYLGAPKLMRVPEDKATVYVIVVIVCSIVVNIIVSAIAGAVISMGARAATPAYPRVVELLTPLGLA